MNNLKVIIIIVLSLEQFAQAQTESDKEEKEIVYSASKGNVFSSLLGSLFNQGFGNAGNSTDGPVYNLTLNGKFWPLKQPINGVIEAGVVKEVTTSTENTLHDSPANWDTWKWPELPPEGNFGQNSDEQNKYFIIRPLIKEWLKQPSQIPNLQLPSIQFTVETNTTGGKQKDKITEKELGTNSTKLTSELSNTNELNLVIAKIPWLKNAVSKVIPKSENGNTLNKGEISTKQGNNVPVIEKRSVKEDDRANIKETQNDPDQYNTFDDYKPIKPDLSLLLKPESRPDFDIDFVLGQLAGLISTSKSSGTTTSQLSTGPGITTQIKNNLLTTSSSKVQDEINLVQPTLGLMGQILSITTQTPIIGPLNSPDSSFKEKSSLNTHDKRDGYNLIAPSNIGANIDGLSPSLPGQSQREGDSSSNPISKVIDENNSVFVTTKLDQSLSEQNVTQIAVASSTKKRKFPWPINKKNQVTSTTTSTTTTTTSTTPILLDKIDDYYYYDDQEELKSSSIKYEVTKISTTDKSVQGQKTPRLPTISLLPGRPFFTLKSTKKPKLPAWLSNIFNTILPKPTARSSPKSSLFQTRKHQDNIEEISKLDQNSVGQDELTRKLSENNQDYIDGSNSVVGLAGIGISNGQGGISFGFDSGIGKRASKKPYVAKPIVVYNTKATKAPDEDLDESK